LIEGIEGIGGFHVSRFMFQGLAALSSLRSVEGFEELNL
jgi:hypothetical protein